MECTVKLIKYCKEEFNYSKSDRLQVATLDYFRNLDNNFIADPSECIGGPYSIKPTETPEEITQGFINQIGGGIVKKGALPGDPIVIIDPGAVFNINKKFKFPNVYIFCCSYEEYPSKETAKGLGYNSWYEIVDPVKFMKEIENGFPEVAKLKYRGLVSGNVIHIHGPVNYAPREHQVFETEFDLDTNLLFTKPKVSEKDSSISYEDNKEYRFVWIFENNNTSEIMEVEKNPILVKISNALKKTLK